MSPSSAEADFLDRGLADAAGLVGAVVNPRHAAVVAVGALDVEVIAKCGAALGDRGCEDIYGGFVESGNSIGFEVAGWGVGMNLAEEEGFVSVDIAQSSDYDLIEDDGFDIAVGFLELGGEIIHAKSWIEGFWS